MNLINIACGIQNHADRFFPFSKLAKAKNCMRDENDVCIKIIIHRKYLGIMIKIIIMEIIVKRL